MPSTEHILQLWRKVGNGDATKAEVREWMAYLDTVDPTTVESGQQWRDKIRREVVTVISGTNHHGAVTVRNHVGKEEIDGVQFPRQFEYVGA